MTCPNAAAHRTLKSGDTSLLCSLIDSRVSQRHVCSVCVTQWRNGPPTRPTPILREMTGQPGIGDRVHALLVRLRLPQILERAGLYDPKTCGCGARRERLNSFGRKMAGYWRARYRLALPE